MSDTLIPLPVKVPGPQRDAVEEMVRRGLYSSSSEAVRDAIRLLQDKYGIYMIVPREEPCPATT